MNYDVIVIGAGPGGYTTACLCAKNGLKVAVVEKDKVGGVCLNIGCIPTKALINYANHINFFKKNDIFGINPESINIDRAKITTEVKNIADNVSKGIDFLFKQSKVDLIIGSASITDKNTIIVNNKTYTANNLIIATGSKNKGISNFIQGDIDKDKIITSTEALFLDKNPSSIIILGAGAIGVEFAYIFNSMGTNVTLLEYFPNILPNIDLESSRTLERTFKKAKINIITGAKVTQISQDNDAIKVNFIRDDKEQSVNASIILSALGRTPNTDIDGLVNLGLEMQNGYIKANDFMQSSVPNIYAIGDVVASTPLLAHVAYDEARAASEHICKKINSFTVDYNHVPFCIYTEPQIASFGITEMEANDKSLDFKICKVFFKASGKAQAIGSTDGFVKLIVDNKTENLLGAHIVGAEATEIIHELLLAAKSGLKLKDIADTMHAHPTLSESIIDAAKSFYGMGLH